MLEVQRTDLNREADLLEKSRWLANLRWVAIVWMALAAVVASRSGLTVPNWAASLVVISGMAVLNTLWLCAVPRAGWRGRLGIRQNRLSSLMTAQVALDTVVYAVGVHLSGGVHSVLMIFFPFYIAFIGMILPRRVAWLQTAWAIVLVSGLTVMGSTNFVSENSMSQSLDTLATSRNELTWGALALFAAVLCLATFASNSVALLLESKRQQESRLYSEIEKQFVRQNLLSAVAREISQPLDLAGMMVRVLALAQCAVPFDFASILLLEKDGSLRKVAQMGDSRKVSWQPSEIEDYCFRAITNNKPVYAFDNSGPDGVEKGSILFIPFTVQGRIAGSIMVQSVEVDAFSEDELTLFTTLADQVAVAVDNSQLYGQVQETFVSTIAALAAAIDAKDNYTHGHSQHVSDYATAIAESMKLPAEEIKSIRYAALLHDIGKIGISEAILNKEGGLVQIEQEVMQLHPLLGANILKPIPFLSQVIPFVLHHHESYDGSGYPNGLVGEEIPVGARILAVADSFEAMVSGRPYRAALEVEEALAELWRCAGRQFDAKVVEGFLRVVTNNPRLAERAKKSKGHGNRSKQSQPQRSGLLQRAGSERKG